MLIALLLFNWLGYKLVVNYLQQQADHYLELRIDANDYDDSQLIEVRVALNMPYQAVNSSFERHYGEIEISGQYYTYVKRRIEDGFLVLKCIPNHQKEDIQNAAGKFFKTTNGFDKENGKSTAPFAKLGKALPADFDNDKQFFQLSLLNVTTLSNNSFITSCMLSGFATTAERPPKALA